jgi:cytochrome c6
LIKKAGIVGISMVMVFCCAAITCGQNPAPVSEGEGLFKRYCQSCHPGGKNAINPAKTLYVQDLKKRSIETTEAIVKIIRKASPPMPSFDEKTISDKDADAIARYILQTFK